MKRLLFIFIAVVCVFLFSGRLLFSEKGFYNEEAIRIAAVQFEISERTYSSVYSFKKRIDSIVDGLFRDKQYDVVIFPEYTSVFVAIIPYAGIIDKKGDFRTAFRNLKKKHPSLDSIEGLFLKESRFVKLTMDNVFGSLARRYRTFIVGGTYFAKVKDRKGKEVLHNRVVVYGPTGHVWYTQDKVFLTDFEKNVVGLSPGSLKDAKGFVVRDKKIGVTVCRDTFEMVWSKKYEGYDIWVDIKANGARFDRAERESFMKALPARLRECRVKYGVTVCLVGKFLDLFWEGESSFIESRNGEIVFLRRVKNFRKEEILTYDLSFNHNSR